MLVAAERGCRLSWNLYRRPPRPNQSDRTATPPAGSGCAMRAPWWGCGRPREAALLADALRLLNALGIPGSARRVRI